MRVGENLRQVLMRNIFTPACGFSLPAWTALMRRTLFDLEPRYSIRAIFILANSLVSSINTQIERIAIKKQVSITEIPPPVFILGHWRSGTTHLHNLLSIDPRFSCPNYFDVSLPHQMLNPIARSINACAFRLLAPSTRLIDSMPTHVGAPMEDELALCHLTSLSPILGNIFPTHRDSFQKYLTLRACSKEERERWLDGLHYFLQKLNYRTGRQPLLKSPTHTCRIKLILERFPKARFIHIHRNPYEVFCSYRRSIRTMNELVRVGRQGKDDLDTHILDQYVEMYDAFLEEREGIPKGQFYELGYADLAKDPANQLKAIYRELDLGNFDQIGTAVNTYLASIRDYKASGQDQISPMLKAQIQSRWQKYFDHFGYDSNSGTQNRPRHDVEDHVDTRPAFLRS